MQIGLRATGQKEKRKKTLKYLPAPKLDGMRKFTFVERFKLLPYTFLFLIIILHINPI